MAMSKAEMESHRAEYHARLSQARSELEKKDFGKAIAFAMSSWEYILGMMQHERKYEKREFDSVEALEIVLKHAPPLFYFESLEALETLLKNQRQIDRHASDDLADKLAQARARMWDAHRMWSYLERTAPIIQNKLFDVLGGDQGRWRPIVEAWEEAGLVRRTPDAGSWLLSFATRLNDSQTAKCPACGAIVQASKTKFLEEQACPKCREKVLFVLLSN